MKDKIKKSIKINLIVYGIIIVASVVFLVYLAITGKVSLSNMGGFVIAFANALYFYFFQLNICFSGLLLVVLLLGHGLVAIPK